MGWIAFSLASVTTGFIVYGMFYKAKQEEEEKSDVIVAPLIDIPIMQYVESAQALGPREPDDGNYIFINGIITKESAVKVMREIMWLDSDASTPYIVIYLNSAGGDMAATLALCQIMDGAAKPIEIRCLMANSGAALILASGTKGRRFIHKGIKVGIHPPLISGLSDTDIIPYIPYEDMVLSRAFNLYSRSLAQKTKRPLRKVVKNINEEKWFSEEEAIEYGFADSVLSYGHASLKQKAQSVEVRPPYS